MFYAIIPVSAYITNPFPIILSLLAWTRYFVNAFVRIKVHFQLILFEVGKSYLNFSSTGTLSSTSILMYLPMYSNLTQYLPDFVSWGTPFSWGYIFFQTAYPLFTSTIFRCFMICSWEPIQIAALVMNFFVTMSDIWTSLTWTGPSSLGYSFFAAFFLSFAAFSAF